MKRLSVVIANYNHRRFVGLAIDSALKLDWPDVEVVVVDDGSTDGSLEVIDAYAADVRILVTANGGQRVAVNRGFAASTGDVVIFLDADDLLTADLPRRIDAVWGPSVSKVQFQMQQIDEHGTAFGPLFPPYDPPPTSADIRRWMQRTSAYPTPPGSGNAYARWFLERLMPVGPEAGDAADSALLAAAPFLGDVVCAPGATVLYRRHDANDSDLLQDASRFPREVARARARWRLAQAAAGATTVDERALQRSRELLQMRVAAHRLVPAAQPLPGDGWARMLLDAVRSPWQPGPESWRHRSAVLGWCVATLVAPSGAARRLIAARYDHRRR
jgi:hypothetical protein